LKIAVQYLSRTTVLKIYHRNDLRDDQISDPIPTSKDIGKYYHYQDGSNWCAQIIAVRPAYFRTILGICRRADIVIQSKINYPGTNYCGCFKHDTSFHLQKATLLERKQVSDIIKLTKFPKIISDRVRVMLLSTIQEECKNKGIDETWVVDRLISEADNQKNRGIERIEAVKIIARLNGIEPERQDPRFVQNNNYLGVQNNLSLQDQRRQSVPVLETLRATVELLRSRDQDIPKELEVINHPSFPVLPGKNVACEEAEIVIDTVETATETSESEELII